MIYMYLHIVKIGKSGVSKNEEIWIFLRRNVVLNIRPYGEFTVINPTSRDFFYVTQCPSLLCPLKDTCAIFFFSDLIRKPSY